MAGGKTSFDNIKPFLQNTSFVKSNHNALNTLPLYDYIGNTTSTPIIPTTNNHVIIDSGAANTFIVVNTKVKNKTPNLRPLPVTVPNGKQMYTTHTYELDIPEVPLNARLGHVLPGLHQYSLISVP